MTLLRTASRISSAELCRLSFSRMFPLCRPDVKLGGKFLVGFAFGQQLEDFALLRGQEFTG
jgi:hypothetical protein